MAFYSSQSKDRVGRWVASSCRALGWSVNVQRGELSALKFGRPDEPRIVFALDDNSDIVTMFTDSDIVFAPSRMPAEMPWAVVRGNNEAAFGRWGLAQKSDGGGFFLRMVYRALAKGLTPDLFKMICLELVTEAVKLDEWLVDEGFAG